jgi:hypothetical protein
MGCSRKHKLKKADAQTVTLFARQQARVPASRARRVSLTLRRGPRLCENIRGRESLMNEMKAKAERLRFALRLTTGLIPSSAFAWTVEDWQTLWLHMQAAIEEIAARHKEQNDEPRTCS